MGSRKKLTVKPRFGKIYAELLAIPRKRGRPRQDDRPQDALRLHRDGMTWTEVAEFLNKKYNIETTAEAVRKLAGSRTLRSR